MKILVIGGSGFIGSNLVRELLRNGHDVKMFDKNPSKLFREICIVSDVRNQDALNNSLKGFDIVYNLAAEHRDDVSPSSLYFDVNVQGAKNIVHAAEINNVKKIIFTSSVAVYGLNKVDPGENSPVEPFNAYGKSKLEAEVVFNQWVEKEKNRSLAIVRPVVIFGENNRGNVYNLIDQVAQNKFLMVGSGKNKKAMAYVGNVVDFLVKASDIEPGRHLFNFSDKPDMETRELIVCIRTELGIKSNNLIKLPYLVGLAGGYFFDILALITNKKYAISSIRIKKFCANTTVSITALEALNFKSPFSIKEGLKRMISSIKDNKKKVV